MDRFSPQEAAARRARLDATIAALQYLWGPRIIRRGPSAIVSDGSERFVLSTGSFGLDLLVGGLPRGAITELAGAGGTGVETLAMTALADCQRRGGLAVLVDVGMCSDPDALASAGVDHTRLILACPVTAIEAWSVLAVLARSDTVDLIVVSLDGLAWAPGDSSVVRRRGVVRTRAALRGRQTALVLLSTPYDRAAWVANAPPLSDITTIGGATLVQAATLRVLLVPTGPRLTPYGDLAALGAHLLVLKYHGLPCGPPLPLETTARGVHRSLELVMLGQMTAVIVDTPLGLVMDVHVLGRTPLKAALLLDQTPALADDLAARLRSQWESQRESAERETQSDAEDDTESGVA